MGIFIACSSSSSLTVFTFKNLSSFVGNWNSIFSRTHYRRIQNVMKYIKVIPRATAVRDSVTVREISFPQTARATTCREWKFRDDWKRAKRSIVSCKLGRFTWSKIVHESRVDASPPSCYEYLRVECRFHVRNFSTRICQETNSHRFESTRGGATCAQLCMIQLNPSTVSISPLESTIYDSHQILDAIFREV